LGPDDSAQCGLGPTLLNLGPNCLGSTWIGPSQNPTQNTIWIIQKCIQSISNPYPIKWIGFKIQKYRFGFEINPFQLIKTNMDLDNYGLDFVIWIFCPPLISTMEMFCLTQFDIQEENVKKKTLIGNH